MLAGAKSNNPSGRAAFVIAVIVLGLAAVGLNGATQFMQLYFKKLPVDLRLPLQEIPAQLGPWRQLGIDRPLPTDVEHTLGTEKYVMRMYVDTRLVKPEYVADANSEDPLKHAAAQEALKSAPRTAFVNMGVTYYTGLVDTVAHIPDRCYVADGYQPTQEPEVLTWHAAGRDVQVRYINFEDQTARGLEPKNVAYFFQVNGGYEHDPITGVRLRLQNLRERHGYYAKIEVMNQVKDQSAAREALSGFVAAALPEIERCLPDWEQVKASERAGK